MKKSILIARSNFRKAKGQTVAVVALLFVASLMMNLWLMLSTDYRRNFERAHDRLNAEHVTLAVTGNDSALRKFLAETLERDERTVQYCMDDCLEMVGSFDWNGGEVNTEFVILRKETASDRAVGRIEIAEDGGAESGMYFPMLYGTDKNIRPGEKMELIFGSRTVRFPVCGFLNSVMTGSHNCGMSAILMTEDVYGEFRKTGIAPEGTLVSVRIRDREESREFEADLKNAVSQRYPGARMQSNSYSMVRSSRYISQMICSGIVSAMAFFVALIALAVIVSSVVNYIQENMPAIGVLKAAGYQNRQIMSVLLLQFLSITLATAAAGVLCSYALFPAVNDMMISQTGIPYEIRFLPLPFVVTLLCMGGAVASAVWFPARKIRKIEPVTALRGGIKTHSFRKNHVPLKTTRLPLVPALGLKTTFCVVRQNIIVCITMLVLSLVVVFSGLMVENMIVDMEPFIHLIVGETADSCINISAGIEETFLAEMKKEERVEKIYLFHTTEVRHVGGYALMVNISDDFSDLNDQEICVSGRYPQYDNEVAVGAKYAREEGLNIGDEITLTADGRQESYLISGFTQMSNNLGRDGLLTRSGYERMGVLENAGYYLNLTEGTDVDVFQQDVSDTYGADINAVINIRSVVAGSSSVYISLMTMIVIAVLVLSIFIITFVLYLLVKTMLGSRKREYGILKALGFTTGQLILKTAASFMPAIVLSTVVGLCVGAVVINPLTALFLRGIGIVKCTFTVPAGFTVMAGAGLILAAFLMACLLSLKIRKITPKVMLTGE